MGLIHFITLVSVWTVVVNAAIKKAADPCLLDAALYSTETKDIYFFKDDRYARWNTKTDSMYDYGMIKDAFPGVLFPIDATVEHTWNKNRETYFVKGNQMQKFSFAYNKVINNMTLGDFASGLQGPIDSSAWHNDGLYFFSGKTYQMVKNRGGQGQEIVETGLIKDKFPAVSIPIYAATYRFLAGNKKSAYFFDGPTTYLQVHADSSTTRLDTATYWPGLIESPLLKHCGCTCDDVTITSDKWRFANIEYSGLLSAYSEVGTGEYLKPVETTDMADVPFTFRFTDHFAFKHLKGTPVTSGTPLVDHTPDFGYNPLNSDKVQSVNVSPEQYYFKHGETILRDYCIQGQFTCASSDRESKVRCTAFRKTYDIKADYVMTWVNKNRGCKCTSSGETDFRISHYNMMIEEL